MTVSRERTLASEVIANARAHGRTIATAESCTGGLLGGALTAIPGASLVFTHGFITYANAAKISMLSVPEALIEAHGAVSAEVARAMASGARRVAGTDIGIGITGIAGPDGGSPEKPVGLVFIATSFARRLRVSRRVFNDPGRDCIRIKSVEVALHQLLYALQATAPIRSAD